MQPSKIHSHIGPRKVRSLALPVADCDVSNALALASIGIGFRAAHIEQMASWAMDALEPSITPGSIGVPAQFLQQWLPGFVRIMTAARKIDELIGITTAGSWEDEEVVQGILEPLGEAELYGDYTNIPLSSFNTEFARRTVVRFEKGMRVGALEEARMSRIRVNTAAEKRNSAALSLDVARNRVGFYGYNGGQNRTYGFLNDPSLPAYVTASTKTAGGTTWAVATFLEITADIRGMVARIMAAAEGTIDPETSNFTLAVALDAAQFLSITSVYGNSVRDWIKENYPQMRIVTAPELNAANGGANVAYMYPESISGDDSTDDGRVWIQIVPTRFQTLGTEKQAKAFVEDYTNATAGVLLKRPYAVQRLTGI